MFAGAIVVSLLRGRAPDCHCFGQLHSAPAGAWTLARIVRLGALAVAVVARGSGAGQLSPVGWIDRLSTVEVVLVCVSAGLAVAVACLGWFCVELFRQHGGSLRVCRSWAGRGDRGAGGNSWVDGG